MHFFVCVQTLHNVILETKAWLHNLWGPVQNENSGLVQILLRMSKV